MISSSAQVRSGLCSLITYLVCNVDFLSSLIGEQNGGGGQSKDMKRFITNVKNEMKK